MGELQPCEWRVAEQNSSPVTELTLSKTANTMRQGEWDPLCASSLFFSGLQSTGSLDMQMNAYLSGKRPEHLL